MVTLRSVSNDSLECDWIVEYELSTWTKEENKQFESALAIYDHNTPDRWGKVAALIPGKSVSDVVSQYEQLQEDVREIEEGVVPVPCFVSSDDTMEECWLDESMIKSQERKKGVPWTEDEHRRFLLGLMKHGKGDWRNISRYFVITKTPGQVASHAQKYYKRMQEVGAGGKSKKRHSIHDTNLTEASHIPLLEQAEPDWSHDVSHCPQRKRLALIGPSHHPNIPVPSHRVAAAPHENKVQGNNLSGSHNIPLNRFLQSGQRDNK